MKTGPFGVFLTLSLLLSGGVASTAHAGELLTLSPSLTRELDLVLKASDGLHHALLINDEEQVEIGLRDVIHQLEVARSAAHAQMKPHERAHLDRILDSAHEFFELTQSAYGSERRARLADGFNQLVNLVRIYRLDRAYAIFYCPKDNLTWVQKGDHAKNPFHEGSREPCGMKVPR